MPCAGGGGGGGGEGREGVEPLVTVDVMGQEHSPTLQEQVQVRNMSL